MTYHEGQYVFIKGHPPRQLSKLGVLLDEAVAREKLAVSLDPSMVFPSNDRRQAAAPLAKAGYPEDVSRWLTADMCKTLRVCDTQAQSFPKIRSEFKWEYSRGDHSRYSVLTWSWHHCAKSAARVGGQILPYCSQTTSTSSPTLQQMEETLDIILEYLKHVGITFNKSKTQVWSATLIKSARVGDIHVKPSESFIILGMPYSPGHTHKDSKKKLTEAYQRAGMIVGKLPVQVSHRIVALVAVQMASTWCLHSESLVQVGSFRDMEPLLP